ncbi:MAG: tetratricopeptide repeat protein, partial [bacterium]
LRRIIKIYYNSSRYEDAYEYCKMMIQSYLLNKQDYILLIKIFFKLGKYEELLGILNGLSIGERDYELQFYYAYCNLKCGMFSVAKKYFEKLHLDFPFNTKFSYYYFYSLLRMGDYENARQLFNNFKEYDDLFRNYIELLFVFKDCDLLIEKGINFLNSYDIDLSQKSKILEFIIRSLYDKKEFEKLVNIEKILKIENVENLFELFNDDSKIIFIKSLLIKRDYLKIAYYFDNFSKFFMVDVNSESLNMDYCTLYLICLFKIGRIDDAINFYRELKEKTQKNLKIFLIIELIVNLYTKNWVEGLRLVNENYRDLPNFYVIFAIRYNYLDNEKISEIYESLSDFLKDMLKVFNFDYNKIEISNLNNFMKILEDLEKYVKDTKIDEILYLLPDNIVDFYLYSPIYLFLHLLMSNIEVNMIEEKWSKVNVFRKLNLDERQLVLQKISSLIDSLKINFYGEEFYKPYILAKYSIISGDLDRALSFLFESINHNKYFYSSRILLSLIYYLREMYDLAIEQLMEIYSEDDDLVRFLLAKNYMATKSLKLADEEFSYLLSKEGDNLKYIYYKVLTNVYMMNFKAVSLIEESYSKFKNKGKTIEFLQASLYLAHIYILIKKYKEAEEILLDLINYFPYEEDIYKYLAIVYISTNQVPKVLNVYNLGLRNISGSSELYSQRGILYYKAGKLDLAEKDFLRSYELNKIDFVAVSHLGLIFLRKGDLSKALNYFREAIAIKPLAYEVYANIGTVYEKMGKIIEAREYFEVAYEYNPSNVQNIKKLVEILKKM